MHREDGGQKAEQGAEGQLGLAWPQNEKAPMKMGVCGERCGANLVCDKLGIYLGD